MHTTSGKTTLGITCALTTAVLWGLLPVFLKMLLGTMDAYTITWYRFLAAAIILGIYLGLKHQLPNPFQTANSLGATPFSSLGRMQMLLLMAGLSLCSNYAFYLIGLDHLSAETAQVVIQAAPFLMMLGAVVIFKEGFSRRQRVATLLLLPSLLLFFNERLALLFAPGSHYGTGVLWIFVAAAVWAVYALAQKQLLLRFNSMQIMFMIYVMGAIVFLPFATPAQILALSDAQRGYLVFCCLNTLIAYGAFAEALQHWEASRVSAVLATTPLVTILAINLLAPVWPAAPAPDDLNWLAYAGAIGVVIGSAITALAKSVPARTKAETAAAPVLFEGDRAAGHPEALMGGGSLPPEIGSINTGNRTGQPQ